MGYTIFHAGELDWRPRARGRSAPRRRALRRDDEVAREHLPLPARRRRAPPHRSDPGGGLRRPRRDADGPPGRRRRAGAARARARQRARSSSRAPRCSSRTAHDEELRLFIVGAPPERGQATFLERDRMSAFDDVRSIVPRQGLGRDHGPRRPRRAADARRRRARAGRRRRGAQPRARAARDRPARLDPLPRRRRGARPRPRRDLGDPVEHAAPSRGRARTAPPCSTSSRLPAPSGSRPSRASPDPAAGPEPGRRTALYFLSVSSPGSRFSIGGSM